jgi:TPR repeat protein
VLVWPVLFQPVRAAEGAKELAGTQAPTPVPTTDVEVIFWNSVKDSGDAGLLQTYLDRYPNGAFAPIAKLKIERLNAQPALTPSDRLSDEPGISSSESYGRQEVLNVTLGGSKERGVLGMRGQTLDAYWQIAIGPEAKGAIVVAIVPGGAAEQVRLRPGDLITRIEGQNIAAMPDVARLVAQAGAGKQVSIQIWRPDGDYKTLVARLTSRANRNDAHAALALADIYRLGFLGREDLPEALKWQRKAAETGSTEAMIALGTMLAASQGADKAKDATEAVSWFRKASEAGDARAMHALGVMHDNGHGTAKDAAEAARWFRKGADAGNGDAMAAFGQMQLDGRGTAKDEAAGVALMRKAADAGNVTAMAQLGVAYADGRGGLAKDETEAARWYRRAADSGLMYAQYRLGLAYHYGQGVPKDEVEAMANLRRAADGGFAAAMAAVGDMYANGFGTPKDEAEATRWYRKGIDMGEPSAMYTMAIRTEFAIGGPKNTEEAARLALASVKGGYDYARTQLIAEAGKWGVDFRRALQRQLKEAGFYSGDVDGRMGDGVKDALDRLAKSGTASP